MTSLPFRSYHGTTEASKCCVCLEEVLAKTCFHCSNCVDGVICKECAYEMPTKMTSVFKFVKGTRKKEITTNDYETKKVPEKCPCCRAEAKEDLFTTPFGQVGVRYAKLMRRSATNDADYPALNQKRLSVESELKKIESQEVVLRQEYKTRVCREQMERTLEEGIEVKSLEDLIEDLQNQLHRKRHILIDKKNKIKDEVMDFYSPQINELSKKKTDALTSWDIANKEEGELVAQVRAGVRLPKTKTMAMVDKLSAEDKAELLKLLSAK